MPRFREESFRFVVMDDGNPVSEATALAMKVRDTIRDAARDVPGIRIAWPGDQPGVGLLARATPLDCTKSEENYLIGVELTESRRGIVDRSCVGAGQTVRS